MLVANYDFEVDKQVAAEEAFEKGEKTRAKKDAVRMLKAKKLSLEDIANYCELSLSEVEDLKQSLFC